MSSDTHDVVVTGPRRVFDDAILIGESSTKYGTHPVETTFLYDLLEAVSAVIVVFDRAGDVRFANSAARETLSLDDRAMRGLNVATLVPLVFDVDGPYDPTGFSDCVESLLSQRIEVSLRAATGEDVISSFVINETLLDAERLFTLTAHDVTDARSVEQDLIKGRNDAEETARFHALQLASLTHELRTTLSGIHGFAEILSRDLTGKHKEFSEIVRDASARMLNTLESEMHLTLAETQSPTLKAREFDLCREVKSVAMLFEPIATMKGLQIKVDCGTDAIPVKLDTAFVRHIVQNLVANAIKYTDLGLVNVRVRQPGDGTVEIEVHDTGSGIPVDKISKLFHVFEQMPQHRAMSDGVGLGLAITRRLVNLLQGRIDVTSRVGEGTRFVVTLPARID